eukprot:9493224-Pyramimonas_sp.AAC.1
METNKEKGNGKGKRVGKEKGVRCETRKQLKRPHVTQGGPHKPLGRSKPIGANCMLLQYHDPH